MFFALQLMMVPSRSGEMKLCCFSMEERGDGASNDRLYAKGLRLVENSFAFSLGFLGNSFYELCYELLEYNKEGLSIILASLSLIELKLSFLSLGNFSFRLIFVRNMGPPCN